MRRTSALTLLSSSHGLALWPWAFLAVWRAWTDLRVRSVPASRSHAQMAPETTVWLESLKEPRPRNTASTLERCADLECHGILALGFVGLCVCKKHSVCCYHLASMFLNWLKLFLIHWLYFPAPPVCLSWVHIEGGPQKSCTEYINFYRIHKLLLAIHVWEVYWGTDSFCIWNPKC